MGDAEFNGKEITREVQQQHAGMTLGERALEDRNVLAFG